MPRSTAYYRPHDRVPTIDDVLAQRIKHLIDEEPYLGYRMVWARLRMQGLRVNRKAVQRVMQLMRWQCHRRWRKRCGPRVESSPSVATVSNLRWATDTIYVWTELDGLVYFNAVLDCADRECIGVNISQRNDAKAAVWALEHALLERFGSCVECKALAGESIREIRSVRAWLVVETGEAARVAGYPLQIDEFTHGLLKPNILALNKEGANSRLLAD